MDFSKGRCQLFDILEEKDKTMKSNIKEINDLCDDLNTPFSQKIISNRQTIERLEILENSYLADAETTRDKLERTLQDRMGGWFCEELSCDSIALTINIASKEIQRQDIDIEISVFYKTAHVSMSCVLEKDSILTLADKVLKAVKSLYPQIEDKKKQPDTVR